jgi:hypothetical protein
MRELDDIKGGVIVDSAVRLHQDLGRGLLEFRFRDSGSPRQPIRIGDQLVAASLTCQRLTMIVRDAGEDS